MLHKMTRLCAGLCPAVLCPAVLGLAVSGMAGIQTAAAQEAGGPPKILLIDVEYLKTTTSMAAHHKTESAFVDAAKQANAPERWTALASLTGQPRDLFIFGFDSLADYEKNHLSPMSHPELAATIDTLTADDGALLSTSEGALYKYREDLSHKANVEIGKMRYMEITRVQLKPGHGPEWEQYLKMLQAALDKFTPDRHLAVFQSLYGRENGGLWLLFIPLKSLDEADRLTADREGLTKKMGAADADKFRGLVAASLDHSQRNLFVYDPAMSYPP
ncbi:MAG: hypothetical protein JWM54_18, partial [Acidobacteriaceae bacterium]|nr:hypothetical protein [Acidobacteriaceae bacterium]